MHDFSPVTRHAQRLLGAVIGSALLLHTLNVPVFAKASAYVTCATANTVAVIDLATQTVVAQIPVGDTPYGVASSADGALVYVVSTDGDAVSIIDTSTNTVAATAHIAGLVPFAVTVAPEGGAIYTANFPGRLGGAPSITRLDPRAGTISNIVLGGTPVGIAVHPNGSVAYVAEATAARVTVIDTATNTVTATIPVGAGPRRIVVAADGSQAFVSNGDAHTVSVIDTAANTVTDSIDVERQPIGMAVTPDGMSLYVANHAANVLSVIDVATHTVTATIAVGVGPREVAVDAGGAFVYVTNDGSDSVSAIEVTTHAVVKTIAVDAFPFGIAIATTSDP